MKQAIVVRKDLKMGCGKIAGQVAHASVRSYKEMVELNWEDNIKEWFEEGETKIVLKVQSDKELGDIIRECVKKDLLVVAVHDLGKTQIEADTLTAIAIGPYPDDIIDSIVGDLKLL